MGGERKHGALRALVHSGSSPHGRGTRQRVVAALEARRFIPAWAGNAFVLNPLRKATRGSSPHGRGTPIWGEARHPTERFIPAWAGNAPSRARGVWRPAVHPRMGGERRLLLLVLGGHGGSSPHGRGTHQAEHGLRSGRRFIPAWAGNAERSTTQARTLPVHPRMGGERRAGEAGEAGEVGSSPHGRGTRSHRRGQPDQQRFIPAWAGNARQRGAGPVANTVHPRMGGEREPRKGRWQVRGGSSPHGRGTQRSGVATDSPRRFIPAWAGNALHARERDPRLAVHPRMGGERAPKTTPPTLAAGSSPHGRGTRPDARGEAWAERFIPAWAGNAAKGNARRRGRQVHPRMGGERIANKPNVLTEGGSSPHGRGTQGALAVLGAPSRFIPAWAGNARSRPALTG